MPVPDPGSYIPDRKLILFSTEILYNGYVFNFTDGDVIRLGDGVVRAHPLNHNPRCTSRILYRISEQISHLIIIPMVGYFHFL
ncbi:MAG: hypothetical protein ACXQTY_06685, partial [Candidatus Methanogasteraceae archaeon]